MGETLKRHRQTAHPASAGSKHASSPRHSPLVWTVSPTELAADLRAIAAGSVHHPHLPAMALVTLQRSPTPSAASSASTATTTGGEVRPCVQRWDAPVWRSTWCQWGWGMLPKRGLRIEAKLAQLVNM